VPATLAAAPTPAAGCPPVGAVGLLRPHRALLALTASRSLATAPAAEIAYPSDGSVFTAAGLDLGQSCTDSHPIAGTAEVRNVSLFGGVVTASSVTLSLTGGPASVSGLRVGGKPTQLTQGKPIRLGNWGFLLAPDPASASRSAFQIQLSEPRAGLPAGSIVFVPYAHVALVPTPAAPAPTTTAETTPARAPAPSPSTTTAAGAAPTPATHKFPQHDESFDRIPLPSDLVQPPESQPLTVTPDLEGGPYVFPIAGGVSYGDSYGGLRTDVSGSWHHGDDLFAPLGTPVVAVADGTINRVGWERLGGWRLWVRDKAGDQFYYAHLSGYSLNALLDNHVRRGEVIGFVGNTGDAFTTIPHLHFEVHPRNLLHLGYDGAVDPTTYLGAWAKPAGVKPPVPVHPRLPRAAAFRLEAVKNFRELLAARGLTHRSQRVAAPTPIRLPVPVTVPAPNRAPVAAAVTVVRSHGWTTTDTWIVANAAMAVLAVGLALWRRRLRAT
jgi:murein DD-endopeptidase MepM/ murein hydrolase activator NlpD